MIYPPHCRDRRVLDTTASGLPLYGVSPGPIEPDHATSCDAFDCPVILSRPRLHDDDAEAPIDHDLDIDFADAPPSDRDAPAKSPTSDAMAAAQAQLAAAKAELAAAMAACELPRATPGLVSSPRGRSPGPGGPVRRRFSVTRECPA